LNERQVPATPTPGSPESFIQAGSIIGGLAKALQGSKGFQSVPFGTDSANALQGLADGLTKAGKGGAAKRQAPASPPPPGSPQSYAQASAILGGLAKGLQGSSSIPFGQFAGTELAGLAEGLGKAGQAAKGGS
jgi:hypothetical protein